MNRPERVIANLTFAVYERSWKSTRVFHFDGMGSISEYPMSYFS